MRTSSFSLIGPRWQVAVGLLTLLLGLASPTAAQAPPPPPGPVSYQTFYDALAPYGQWVNDPDYGYAWVPTAGSDFQPYRSNGHWVYTDYGWTWVSDYAWGWAPFHYGRWRYSDGYGWLWVPGYSWGPAWVAWRQSAGYYGWAPLGPPPVRGGVHVSIGFSFSFGDAPVAPALWCFVPAAYVASPRIATYYVPPAQTTVVYNTTTVIHNTYINKQVNVTNNNNTVNNTTVVNTNGPRPGGGFPAGPARTDVERATGQPLQQVAVTNRATPGTGVQGRALAFYRPEVAAPSALTGPRANQLAPAGTPAPSRVVPLAEAARQARAINPDAAPGLQHGKADQQLNSADPHPFRDARAAATQPPAANGSTLPAPPSGPDRRNRAAAGGQGGALPLGGTPAPSNSPMPIAPAPPTGNQASLRQAAQQQHQQDQQARQAAQQQQQAQRQQAQQQHQQDQQARQAAQQQQQAQRQQAQQQHQQDQQARQAAQQQQQAQRQQAQQARQQQQQMRQQQAQQQRKPSPERASGEGERPRR